MPSIEQRLEAVMAVPLDTLIESDRREACEQIVLVGIQRIDPAIRADDASRTSGARWSPTPAADSQQLRPGVTPSSEAIHTVVGIYAVQSILEQDSTHAVRCQGRI